MISRSVPFFSFLSFLPTLTAACRHTIRLGRPNIDYSRRGSWRETLSNGESSDSANRVLEPLALYIKSTRRRRGEGGFRGAALFGGIDEKKKEKKKRKRKNENTDIIIIDRGCGGRGGL